MAQIMQEPRNKPGTAVVLRGGMGVGKTIVGQVVGSLLGRHYVYADDPRYLVGNFNIHMATCLFLQADEAVWAGDKHAEGRLKGLVTSTSQMIEAKGVDPVKLDNHLRLLMTSNSDWVVPAGKDERRFAIFEVAPHCAQRHEYFGELLDEIENGGRERLLYELLQVDLSAVNLRDIPKTEALFEQKVHSLDPIEAWLFERLQAGTPTRKHELWPEFVKTSDLVDDYIATAERVGISRRSTESQFGIKLKKLMPAARPCRRLVPADGGGTSVTRATGYDLPALHEARSAFEETLQQPIEWGSDDHGG
ncbi:primase-helicase family protein [Fulvimarina sp. MAC3]|uniref:primase-helicase family protein n=1 Tax=Fulvimarina sp. MAC3 TaxID=3148887 RepID=UPI0031FE35A3